MKTISLLILCVLIFGFIDESNGCCCEWFCFNVGTCNVVGCNCDTDKCWAYGTPPPWCLRDERCEDKKFRLNTNIAKEGNTDTIDMGQWYSPNPEVRFNMMDINKDGSISFDEFGFLFDIFFPNSTTSKQLVEQKKKQSFEEMDKDNDKIIIANEFDRDLE